tara:strand:- start:784 stop:957 length:174 start_codon:yes stop_codon:yes gene_type:complete
LLIDIVFSSKVKSSPFYFKKRKRRNTFSPGILFFLTTPGENILAKLFGVYVGVEYQR